MKGNVSWKNIAKLDAGLLTRCGTKFAMVTANSNYFTGSANSGEVPKHIDVSSDVVAFEEVGECGRLEKAERLASWFWRRAFWVSTRRIRFTGKGYKLKRSKRSLAFRMNFGRSHKIFALSGGMRSLKLSKYVMLLLGNDTKVTRRGSNLLTLVRKANPYTKRGIRQTRQAMKKRPGKKTNY